MQHLELNLNFLILKKSKKLCMNPVKSNNELTITKPPNNLTLASNRRPRNLFEQENDYELSDNMSSTTTTRNGEKRLKEYAYLENDDDEDSVPINDNENSETRSNSKTRAQKREQS